MKKSIPVTKPFLPPKAEYQKYLDVIWASGWLTNGGDMVTELERRLEAYLGVRHCIFVSNGTIALQIALKVLNITKEVITTPYSYVATTNAILWENCKPVFADIDSESFSINPDLIEAAITNETEAILATNCYGIPCDFKMIQEIADKHKLKVIYDSAHAFKVEQLGNSILKEGDLSTLSFHATKLFHTVEGGAIICSDDALAEKIKLYRSFGHSGDDYYCLGINGKNSEFHAAMGHCVLDFMPQIIDKRKDLWETYKKELVDVNENGFTGLKEVQYNYSYYPLVLESEAMLLRVLKALHKEGIFPRRYFSPSLNNLPHHKGASCPVSESISKRVICLPLYFELKKEEVVAIAKVIKMTI
jgi:dTDP-4-amino-4,6-dideoxygalactose transaminase